MFSGSCCIWQKLDVKNNGFNCILFQSGKQRVSWNCAINKLLSVFVQSFKASWLGTCIRWKSFICVSFRAPVNENAKYFKNVPFIWLKYEYYCHILDICCSLCNRLDYLWDRFEDVPWNTIDIFYSYDYFSLFE